ncbi:hypothetical protein IGK16_002993 [Enterococcus pernyi]
MKHKKRYILIIGMLLIQVYAPIVVYGTEVRSVETEGNIGFTGVYETPGTPEPAPEVVVKPSFPKEIAQSPSEVRKSEHKRLPQTNESQMSTWKMLGIMIIVVTLSFWFWNRKKKKQIKKVGFKYMKFVRLATIAVLSSTIFAGGITAFAEETPAPPPTPSTETRRVTTEGQIIFTPNTDEELVVVPPEEGPGVDINPEVPGTTGPLSIMKAVTMNFGSQVISNQDQTYNMIAEKQQKTGTTGEANKVPYVSFAQVQDVRGTNAGWDLQVRMTDFKATKETVNDTLCGAQISLLNPRIQYEGSTAGNAPVAHAAELRLIPNASAVPVMTAAKDKGAGVSSVVWGNQANLNTQEADPATDVVTNSAIQLFVPGSTAKDAAQYKSTLTWELSTTPDNEDDDEEDVDQPDGNDGV